MTKHTYIATFADGTTISRKTDRTYTHAWRAGTANGFSGSHILAIGAKHAAMKYREGAASEVVAVALAPQGFEKQFKKTKKA